MYQTSLQIELEMELGKYKSRDFDNEQVTLVETSGNLGPESKNLFELHLTFKP